MERQRLSIPVAHPVAIVIAPTQRVETPIGLRGVVGQLPDVGIPDPQQGRHRTGRKFGQIAQGARQHAGAIDRHGERAAELPVAEQRMRLGGIVGRAQVEIEICVDVAPVGVDGELRRLSRTLHIVRRDELLAHVGLIRDHLVDRYLQIGREAPDEAPNPGTAQKEGRVRDQLDRLSGVPAHEAVRPIADRLASKWGAAPLIARDRPQQVRRQDAHMIDGVIEHLGIALAEPEHRRERIALGDARNALQLGPERRGDRGVGIGVERELDVGGGHVLAVVPARARIDMEDQRQRAVPLPFLCEQRLKVVIAERVLGRPDVRELQEQLLVDVVGHDVFARRREQRPGLGDGGIDERAAARAGASTVALATSETDDKGNDEGED